MFLPIVRKAHLIALFTVFESLVACLSCLSSVNLAPELNNEQEKAPLPDHARYSFHEIPFPFSYGIRKVVFANGRFFFVGVNNYYVDPSIGRFAPGSGIILQSDDGRDWRAVHTNEFGLNSIASDGTRLVAVGNNGSIATSANGEPWQTITNATASSLVDVAYGDGKWVAVGAKNAMAISNDGLRWTAQNGPPLPVHTFTAIAHGNHRFVAIGGNHLGYAYTSTNAVDWTTISLLDAVYPLSSGLPPSVTYGDGRFVTVGPVGRVLISTNGTNWARTSARDSFWRGYSVIYAQGRFISVGRREIMSSQDAVRWSVDYPKEAFATNSLMSIAYGNGVYVMAALSNTNPYSSVIYRSTVSKPQIDRMLNRSSFTFTGGTASRYAVEATSSLSAPSWTPIGEVTALDGVGTFEDQSAGSSPQRFYRLSSP